MINYFGRIFWYLASYGIIGINKEPDPTAAMRGLTLTKQGLALRNLRPDAKIPHIS